MADELNGTAAAKTVDGLMGQIIEQGHMVRDESQLAYASNLLSEYANQVLEGGMTIDKESAVAGIKQRIAQIDELLSQQVNEIMHAPEFQKLEASWRGLHFLVMNTETGVMLKLR